MDYSIQSIKKPTLNEKRNLEANDHSLSHIDAKATFFLFSLFSLYTAIFSRIEDLFMEI